MGLPENNKYDFNFAPLLKTVKNIAQSLGPKYINNQSYSPASQFGNLLKTVSTSLKNIGRISTTYGGSTRYEKFHPGVDIANKMGTPIPFNVSGRVAEVASGRKQGEKNYGNYVIVVDNEGNRHRYSHLKKSYVKVGQQVQKGQTGMEMGNTGMTYSPSGGDASHLDYRILNAYGKYINPMKFITG